MSSLEKLKKKQNHRLVERRMELLYKILTDQARDCENQCKGVFGTDTLGLKNHVRGQLAELGLDYTLDGYRHSWDIGFHLKPKRLDMSNPLQRETAFFYENMIVRKIQH